MGAIAAAIIGGVISIGTTIASGAASASQRAGAQYEAKKIYEEQQAEAKRSRREGLMMEQKRLGLEKEKVNQQWQSFVESKKRYREEMNKAALGSIGNTLSAAMNRNASFKDKILGMYS